jgi:cell division protease FtsH
MPKNKDGVPGPPPGHPLAPKPTATSRRKQVAVVLAGLFAIGLLMVPLLATRDGHRYVDEERTLYEALAAIDAGTFNGQPVRWIRIDESSRSVVLQLQNNKEISAHYPQDFSDELVNRLEASGVPFESKPETGPPLWLTLLPVIIPTALILGFLVFMMRRSGIGGAGAKAFTTTTAELGNVPATRFADVVGCDEALEELSEVVGFLHDPARFDAAGARMPRGFLLVGPPGTGKTLLARAVAGEAGVPFYSAAGSDFTEMFVGVGAARVRSLFGKAKKTGGIIFLDELDSVGRARSGTSAGGGGTDERESTLNALLVEMDGFGKDHNIIVIAATNRPDVLDPALLRAGRFDRQVTVSPPDRKGRSRLLELYSKGRKLGSDVDFVALARRMPGLTGADISNLVNQAALEAARGGREELHADDFGEALATVMMGRARKSATVTDRDRGVTAWHEAGHAVVALVVPEAPDPVQVTIIPRGVAGGVTWMGGDDDSFLTRTQAHARLAVSMAGRAAEELLLAGDFTQGASGDLASATNLATRMVAEWGMSSLGLAAVGPEHAGSGLGERVHAEADSLLNDALVRARTVLADHRPLFDAVVAELLIDETIDLDRLQAVRSEVEAAQAEIAAQRIVRRRASKAPVA